MSWGKASQNEKRSVPNLGSLSRREGPAAKRRCCSRDTEDGPPMKIGDRGHRVSYSLESLSDCPTTTQALPRLFSRMNCSVRGPPEMASRALSRTFSGHINQSGRGHRRQRSNGEVLLAGGNGRYFSWAAAGGKWLRLGEQKAVLGMAFPVFSTANGTMEGLATVSAVQMTNPALKRAERSAETTLQTHFMMQPWAACLLQV